jgi:hypothetical protein
VSLTPVSTTLAKLVEKFAAGVVDTSGAPCVATPKNYKYMVVNNLYYHSRFYNQRCVLNVVVVPCKIIFEKS